MHFVKIARFGAFLRFSTLEAICKTLDCQPRDILEYVED
ncbi:MAG: hypothetical protein CMO82_00625 [Winogradskyella sp.]|uniref:Helix-turn-helix domain-containing protein n=1 Tax=Winogradskyella poriferorum TaxID=307627 RepID=A0ABU7W383_9FLAO|nr:hypothetical protein [Winogradskyella sp.]